MLCLSSCVVDVCCLWCRTRRCYGWGVFALPCVVLFSVGLGVGPCPTFVASHVLVYVVVWCGRRANVVLCFWFEFYLVVCTLSFRGRVASRRDVSPLTFVARSAL